jgi:hypothetical protein
MPITASKLNQLYLFIQHKKYAFFLRHQIYLQFFIVFNLTFFHVLSLHSLRSTFFSMNHVDPRFQDARDRLSRLSCENPEKTQIVKARVAKLASILRTGGSEVSPYQASERSCVTLRRSGFDVQNSPAYKYFKTENWHSMKLRQLCGFVKVLAFEAGIAARLDRDAKRERSILFKWLTDNWSILEPVARTVVFEYTIDDDPEQE